MLGLAMGDCLRAIFIGRLRRRRRGNSRIPDPERAVAMERPERGRVSFCAIAPDLTGGATSESESVPGDKLQHINEIEEIQGLLSSSPQPG